MNKEAKVAKYLFLTREMLKGLQEMEALVKESMKLGLKVGDFPEEKLQELHKLNDEAEALKDKIFR